MRRFLLALLAATTLIGASVQAHAAKAEAQGAKKTAAKAVKGQSVKKQIARKPAKKQVAKKSVGNPPRKALARSPASARQLAGGADRPVRKVSLSDDPTRLAIQSASALVIDQASGKALVEKQSDAVLPIASISKLMTAMVVLDARLDLNEVIRISEEDIDSLKGTRSRLPVGTTMTRETALLLALMSSENRAANALGRHYPGGLQAFVRAMNRKAQALGMLSTRFEEPTGLSSNNVSTANDLARMVMAAARYPEIRMYSTTAEAKIELNGRIQHFGNTNTLVRSDNWQIGLSKTGYIAEAGRCLVMQAWVADKPVVIVLLDSQGKMTRVGDANRIKRWMESAAASKPSKAA